MWHADSRRCAGNARLLDLYDVAMNYLDRLPGLRAILVPGSPPNSQFPGIDMSPPALSPPDRHMSLAGILSRTC
jgi:hypothetical protein